MYPAINMFCFVWCSITHESCQTCVHIFRFSLFSFFLKKDLMVDYRHDSFELKYLLSALINFMAKVLDQRRHCFFSSANLRREVLVYICKYNFIDYCLLRMCCTNLVVLTNSPPAKFEMATGRLLPKERKLLSLP